MINAITRYVFLDTNIVSKSIRKPSVLLELGFLSNDRDARSLISPDWRERASASVIRAIDQFFAPRLAAEDESGLQVDAAPTGSIGLAVPEAPQPSEN